MSEVTIYCNVELYSPEPRGQKCIAVAAGRVLSVCDHPRHVGDALTAETVDCGGAVAVPGFIDNHVHIAGGGGALGYSSRSRPLKTGDLVGGSTTTLIGMLGFDSTTRTLRGLLADVKSLREAGVGAYALVGSTRRHPVPTLTGSIADDIVFIDEVLGAGEISISELGYEFDSMGAGYEYVARVAAETVLAGRLAGTAGYVCLQIPPHVGNNMTDLFKVVDRTGIPRRHFLPSHVNQSRGYLDNAAAWGSGGGWVDIGTGYRPDRGFAHAVDPCAALLELLDSGVPAERILLSSDGNGVVPNSAGEPVFMELTTLHAVWRRLVLEHGFSLPESLKFVTSNVAEFTRLRRKGRIADGADAEFVLLDEDLDVRDTIVAGQPLKDSMDTIG